MLCIVGDSIIGDGCVICVFELYADGVIVYDGVGDGCIVCVVCVYCCFVGASGTGDGDVLYGYIVGGDVDGMVVGVAGDDCYISCTVPGDGDGFVDVYVSGICSIP